MNNMKSVSFIVALFAKVTQVAVAKKSSIVDGDISNGRAALLAKVTQVVQAKKSFVAVETVNAIWGLLKNQPPRLLWTQEQYSRHLLS